MSGWNGQTGLNTKTGLSGQIGMGENAGLCRKVRLSPTRTLLCWAAMAVMTALYSERAWAVDWEVPSDVPTIQAAIDLATSGDTIRVSPGTYGSIDYLGKDLVVRSVAGPDVTIIDGQGEAAVRFADGETRAAVVEGFTIRGAFILFGSEGSGVYCLGSSPTIRGNIVEENTGTFSGAGIYSQGGSPRILGNRIRFNVIAQFVADATTGLGAGIYLEGGTPIVELNEISDNGFCAAGAGLYLSNTNAEVFGNRFSSNIASNGGGAYIANGSVVALSNNLFTDNSALGSSSLLGSIGGRGGALWIDATSVTMDGCTFTQNRATGTPSPGLPGSEPHGGAMEIRGGAIDIFQSIVWGNESSFDPEIHDPDDLVSMSYTDIAGGFPGTGNIDADPLFEAGPQGGFYLSQVAAGQAVTSPAVDAGPPSGSPPIGTTRTDEVDDTGVADLGFHYVQALGFERGDTNSDGSTDVSDAIFVLGSLFVPGAPAIECEDAADVNDDGGVDVADAVALLAALFVPGSTPIPPPTSCGFDPTADSLDCAQGACP